MKERSQHLLSEVKETADITNLSKHIEELEQLIEDYYAWLFKGFPPATDPIADKLVLMMRTNQLIGPLPKPEQDS
jgi:hypothetical protein